MTRSGTIQAKVNLVLTRIGATSGGVDPLTIQSSNWRISMKKVRRREYRTTSLKRALDLVWGTGGTLSYNGKIGMWIIWI